jgi:hypothetical protein
MTALGHNSFLFVNREQFLRCIRKLRRSRKQMTKMSIDLFGSHGCWLLAVSSNVIGHLGPFVNMFWASSSKYLILQSSSGSVKLRIPSQSIW